MKIKILSLIITGIIFFKSQAMETPRLDVQTIQDITLKIVQPLRENNQLRIAVKSLYDQMRIDSEKGYSNPEYYAAAYLRVMLEWLTQTNKLEGFEQIGVYRDAFTSRRSEQNQQENIRQLTVALSELFKQSPTFTDPEKAVAAGLGILQQIVQADEQGRIAAVVESDKSGSKKIKSLFDSYYADFMARGGDKEFKALAPVSVQLLPVAQVHVAKKANKSLGGLLFASTVVMGLFALGFEAFYRITADPSYVSSPGYGTYVRYTPHMCFAGLLFVKTLFALLLN